MSKKLRNLSIAVLLVGATTTHVFAQTPRGGVGIGTEQPDPSAALEIQSKEQGFLLPRMSLQQRNGIKSPANGLMVYQTDMLSGIYVYNGKDWAPLTATEAKAIALDPDNWALTGNTNATANSFIGVPAGVPINFRIGSTASGRISALQSLYGLNSGPQVTGNHNTALGVNTLRNTTTSIYNTAVGSNALSGSNTGGANTAVGFNALNANTTGLQNAALGINALRKNTTGRDNLGVGTYSLQENVTGIGNLGIGTSSLANLKTGSGNVAVGTLALGDAGISEVVGSNAQSNRNIAVGSNSSRRLRAGEDNFSAGSNSLFNLVNGSGNVAIGGASLLSLQQGNLNVGIGFEAGYSETGSNKLYIANSRTVTPLIYGDFSAKFISIGDVPVAKRDAIASAGQYGLLVKGGIMTEKIKVALASSTDWADYVFEPTYQQNMLSLQEVEQFILQHKHLPNVPSAQEMVDNGLDVTQTVAKLMEKIEELTLYAIEMDKQIKQLQAENKGLKKRRK